MARPTPRVYVFVLTAALVCGGVGASLPATATSVALLKVDDSSAVGAVGDQRLSLAEALRLTAGELGTSSLSPAERSHVSGDPRRAKRRTIRIVLGRGKVVTTDAALPPLVGVDGLQVEGGGAVLTAGASADTGLALGSSRLQIRDLGVIGFSTGISIVPQGPTNLRSVYLERLRVVASTYDINILGSAQPSTYGTGSGTLETLQDVRIRASRFEGLTTAPSEALVGINVVGQVSSTPALIRDVLIEGNSFGGHMLERIQVVGIQAVGGAVTADGVNPQIQGLRVSGNRFEVCADPCVLTYAALALGGAITGARIDGLSVTGNTMPASGIGVDAIAGYTLAGGVTENSSLRGVVIRNNRIRSAGAVAGVSNGAANSGRCIGIAVVGDWVDLNNGSAQNSLVENVRAEGNHVSGCHIGVLVSGAFAWEEAGGVAQQNAVRNVLIRRNSLEANTIGIHIAGTTLQYTRLLGNSPTNIQAALGIFKSNAVNKVLIDSNTFLGGGTALFVAGASVTDTNGNVVTDNRVSGVTQRAARYSYVQRRCQVIDNHSQDSVGVNQGNVAEAVRC